MNFIKNERSFRAWKKENTNQGDIVENPEKFPCFVYMKVWSFGYEECKSYYLYYGDLVRMKDRAELSMKESNEKSGA